MKLRKIICAVICAATVLSCLAVGTSAADSDFVIEDGVLTRYLGKGGDIVIPEGVVKIGSWVFSEEDVPTTILVPASVKFIDGMAFAGCTTLTDVDVDPKNTAYTSVDGIMYSYDKTVLEQYPVGRKTTKYTVPEHVTTIGNYSMYGNDALAEVVFHDKVTTIQSSAFRSCTQLNNVKLPYGLTFLGDRAFSNCSNLSNISLPDTIKTIDYDAFSYCSSLKSFTVPKSVTHLNPRTFNNCESLVELKVHPDNENYVSIDNVIFTKDMKSLICFPGGIGGKYSIPEGVTRVERYSFYDNTKLTEIIFPDSINQIDEHAFSGLKKIKRITIPKIEKIPDSAFSYCYELENITFSEDVKTIGEYAFYHCKSTKSIVLPYNLTTIGNGAFAYCTALTDITIYDNVTEISKQAFEECPDVTIHCYKGSEAERYAIDNKIKYVSTDKPEFLIENGVLLDCSGNKTNIVIPDTVTEIGPYAFSDCTTAKTITIPCTVTVIGPYAFSGCTSLEDITIPDTVTSIGNSAFRDCTGLTSVTIPNTVTAIDDYAFWGCTALSSINIPDSVTSIGNRAFRDCTSLSQITLPDSLTYIGGYIFANCPDITVHCNEGTYAWQYAVDNGLIAPPVTTTVTTTTVTTPPVVTEPAIIETTEVTVSTAETTEITETSSETTEATENLTTEPAETVAHTTEITDVPDDEAKPHSIIPDVLIAVLITGIAVLAGCAVLYVLNRRGIIDLQKRSSPDPEEPEETEEESAVYGTEGEPTEDGEDSDDTEE